MVRIRHVAAALALGAAVFSTAADAAGGTARKPFAGPRLSGHPQAGATNAFVWGSNSARQLGPTTADPNSTFGRQVALDGFVRSMAFGDLHVLAVLDDGTVQAWGATDLYTGSSAGTANPDPRTLHYSSFRSAVQVAAGSVASYVLLQGGDLYSFGYNGAGQLGIGSIGSGESLFPYRIALSQVVQVDSKCATAAAVDAFGRLFTWGNNASGQLGIGSTGGSSGTPTHVLNNVAQVAVGCDFMMALMSNGQVFAWGANAAGQLGQNNTIPRNTPTVVPVSNVVAIAAGYSHALGLMIDGRISVWGRNTEGQLGLGHNNNQLAPVPAPGITSAISVAGGDYHSLVGVQGLEDDITSYGSGYNDQGQVGGTIGVHRNTFALIGPGGMGNSDAIRRTSISSAFEGDLFWFNSTSGENGYWQSTGSTYRPMRTVAPGWAVFGTGDINFDDQTEVFFYNAATGQVYFWSPVGQMIVDEGQVGHVAPDTGWRPQRVGDLNGDGVADILWRNISSGGVAIWHLSADGRIAYQVEYAPVPLQWSIVRTGDFDGNGVADILWRNTATGQVNIWFRTWVPGQVNDLSLGFVALAWVPQAVNDLDGDGRSDIFWRNTSTGETYIWYMAGNTYAGSSGPLVNTAWNVIAANMINGNEPQSIIYWRNETTGEVWHWQLGNRSLGTFAPLLQGSLGAVGSAWQPGQ